MVPTDLLILLLPIIGAIYCFCGVWNLRADPDVQATASIAAMGVVFVIGTVWYGLSLLGVTLF